MKWTKGLVSTIIPVYNREKLVAPAIESVLAQTYPAVEVILINDGSTDGSGAVLDRYAALHPERIKVIHQGNSGQVVARNNGILAARGEYIAFLDSDDTWLPEKLERQLPLFRPGVGLVYSGVFHVNETGAVLREVPPEPSVRGDVYHRLLVRNAMTGGSVVVTREALDRVGLFDLQLRAAENWDLWIRIARHFKVAYVSAPLVRYLSHPGNMSANHAFMHQVSEQVYAKHLPLGGTDPKLKAIRRKAYAFLHYAAGVRAFGEGHYAESRRHFYAAWEFRLFYKDSLVRYLRSFLGIWGNQRIAEIKKIIS